MRFCNSCGAAIPDDSSAYCPSCGAPTQDRQAVVQQPRAARPDAAFHDEKPVAAARRLQPQHVLFIVLALLVIALGTVAILMAQERPTEPGTIVYADTPAAEGESDPSAADVPTVTAQPADPTDNAKDDIPAASAAPADASAGGPEQFRGFSYHVPAGFVLRSDSSSDRRVYYNEALNMTIAVTVLDTSDPYGVLQANKAAVDGDTSLRMTYSDGRDNWFVRSGYDGNGWVFYYKDKVYTERAGTFASVDFSYPNDAAKPTRDNILTAFVNDFGLS